MARELPVWLLLIALVLSPMHTQAAPVSTPSFMLQIDPPETDADQFVYETVRDTPTLSDFITALNDVIALPRAVEIRLMSCDPTGTDISTTVPVTICYRTIEHTALLDNGLDETARRSQIAHAALFSVLADLAPVMMSQLDLAESLDYSKDSPQLAAALALLVGDGLSNESIEGVARAGLDIADAEENQELPAYWILRGFSRSNTHDMACMLYGSDPRAFTDAFIEITSNEQVSSNRCYGMFSQRIEYWSSALEKYLKR